MRLASIPEKAKQIIDAMRALIEKDETDHLTIDTRGWQHGGKSFTKLVASLYKETKEDLQHQNIRVIFCTVRHFFTGANITPSDLTKGLLVIPISGTSTLSPGGQLPVDTYCLGIRDYPLAICEAVNDFLDIMPWIISSFERGSLGAMLRGEVWTLMEESDGRRSGLVPPRGTGSDFVCSPLLTPLLSEQAK